MSIPKIFRGDKPTEKLAAYFVDIYEFLQAEGVPEERLPSPWHVLSHVVGCLDDNQMREWLSAYVGTEAMPSPEELALELELVPSAVPQKRPRPGYLRALTAEKTMDEVKSTEE